MCRRVFLQQKRERKRKWQSVTTQLLFCHQLNICAAHYKYESSLKRKSQCHWWSQRWCSKLFFKHHCANVPQASFKYKVPQTASVFQKLPAYDNKGAQLSFFVANIGRACLCRPDLSHKCCAIFVTLTGDLNAVLMYFMCK